MLIVRPRSARVGVVASSSILPSQSCSRSSMRRGRSPGRGHKTFVLHNDIRTENNLPTLCVHPQLQEAARAHSKDMMRRDYFSHNTKGRGTFDRRLVRFGYGPEGYTFYRIGENIALGSGSASAPESRMRAWMHSDGHRHTILNGDYTEIGIGTDTGEFKGVTMYTVDFGVRRQ